VTHQACAQSQRTRLRLRYNQNRGEFEYRIKAWTNRMSASRGKAHWRRR